MKNLFSGCLMLLAVCAGPVQTAVASPRANEAWIRLLPGDLPLAGYVRLNNPDPQRRTITGAHSPVFGTIEFHQSQVQSGMARMIRLDHVVIPAEGQLQFAPGGRHLMLFDRNRSLHTGEHVPITLEFADGSHLRVLFTVRGVAAQ